jgi:hypothetical protein
MDIDLALLIVSVLDVLALAAWLYCEWRLRVNRRRRAALLAPLDAEIEFLEAKKSELLARKGGA